MLVMILLLCYFITLITLNSSNLSFDIFNLTYFEYYEYIIDSFDDRNRINLFAICLGDFVIAFIYSRVIYLIFDKKARNKMNLSLK